MTAFDIHLLIAEINVNMKISFTIHRGNISRQIRDLHRSVQFRFMVNLFPDIIQTDHRMVCRTDTLDRCQCDLFPVANLCQRLYDLLATVQTNNICIIKFHVFHIYISLSFFCPHNTTKEAGIANFYNPFHPLT